MDWIVYKVCKLLAASLGLFTFRYDEILKNFTNAGVWNFIPVECFLFNKELNIRKTSCVSRNTCLKYWK